MRMWAERRLHFPDPRQAPSDGLVAIGDEMTKEILLESYSHGIFPWPNDQTPVLWFCPEERGTLDFKDLHVPRSLEKFRKHTEYKITFNQSFQEVIRQCARVTRPGQQGTWITPHMMKHYMQFHQAGYAHSVECWMDGEMVGGLYGVYVAGVFSGESMFFKKSNASKLCLLHLVEVLRDNGLNWMDTQMVTDVMKAMGGKYISREQFLKRLEISKMFAKPLVLPDEIANLP